MFSFFSHLTAVAGEESCAQSAKMDLQIIVDSSGSVGEGRFHIMMKVGAWSKGISVFCLISAPGALKSEIRNKHGKKMFPVGKKFNVNKHVLLILDP